MPELPEVEFARRQLDRWLAGRTVKQTEVEPRAHTFRGTRAADVARLGGSLVRLDRRGKYLMLGFSSGQGAIAHLGMTGKFVKAPTGTAVPYSKARFLLDSGDTVHFRDPRMLGRIQAVRADAIDADPVIAALGMDPLVDGLTVSGLKKALGTTRLALKVALMDQGRIAGLGNIHAAESLFRAGLDPRRLPGSLSDAEWRALARGIRSALTFAMKSQGDGDDIDYVEEPGAENPFLVYGRAGTPCRRCGTVVKKLTQAGRTTHFCPSCQPRSPRRTRP